MLIKSNATYSSDSKKKKKNKVGVIECSTMVNSLYCSINVGGNRAVLVPCAILRSTSEEKPWHFQEELWDKCQHILRDKLHQLRGLALVLHQEPPQRQREGRFPPTLNHLPNASSNDWNGLIKDDKGAIKKSKKDERRPLLKKLFDVDLL